MATSVCNLGFQRTTNSVGSYTTSRVNSRLRLLERERAKSVQQSEFWKRQEAVNRLIAQVSEFLRLEPNWNSYGAEAPTARSLMEAGKFLGVLGTTTIFPTRVMPSAEGGVAIRFSHGIARALVEFLNEGEVNVVLYKSDGNVIETPDNPGGSLDILRMLEKHLSR